MKPIDAVPLQRTGDLRGSHFLKADEMPGQLLTAALGALLLASIASFAQTGVSPPKEDIPEAPRTKS